jgi:signal transduction histidine kinase/CheY-like chemotaxis protein
LEVRLFRVPGKDTECGEALQCAATGPVLASEQGDVTVQLVNTDFFSGGGRVGELMRGHDWSRSPLGPPDSWPPSLRAVVELLLQSQFPMFVAWGAELGFLYNDPYAEILGAKHPLALGRRFEDIWSEIWTDIFPLIDAAMHGQATYHEDLPLVMNRKGYDEQTWFTFSYSPVRDETGKVAGMFCACFETTPRILTERALRDSEAGLRELNETLERRVTDALAEHRLAEAALRQAQKMESIGQLTGGVAHDFNNLLAVFATGVQLMERNITPAQRQRTLDGMRRAVERGTGLTRHLLAFSRRRPINPESIDLRTHLSGMRQMFDGALGGNIKVEMSFVDDLWPVEVDAGELELAILNLCVNARDAMTVGGTITIRAENMTETVGGDEPQEFVKLSVADHGCGMPPEVVGRAFEPFFTTKDVSKGSGLGLPQVYGFAQQSGGRVFIESKVSDGTKVTVVLPRTAAEPARASGDQEVPAATADGSRRGHLLLVEDDREVSVLTKDMLASLGFTVIHVTSADAALGALANERVVDFVLSDVMMPGGVNGVELAREIRRRFPNLPIALMTGYIESAADLDDGEFSLLQKPYTVADLASALNVALE